jgi:hypothetical protein
MERVVQKFSSHAAAEAAERAYYRSLTPAQRVEILLEMMAVQRGPDEAAQGLARVYRIVKRPRR